MVDEKQTILQDIANAIREKDGTTETMTFREMPDRVRAIPSGGGGVNKINLMLRNDKKKYPFTLDSNDLDGISVIPEYAFYNFAGLTGDYIVNWRANQYSFYGTNIESLTFNNLQTNTIGQYAYASIVELKTVVIGGMSSMLNAGSEFRQSYKISRIDIQPVVGFSITGAYTFALGSGTKTASAYRTIVLGVNISQIGAYCFSYNKITSIEIKRTTPPTLASSAFSNATVEKIIVPRGSLSDYQTATNWATYADLMEEAIE